VVRADSRQGDKLRGHLRHQPLQLRVESGDVLRDLPLRLKWRRLGLSTSTAAIPAAFRWRASLRRRSCRSLPPRRTLPARTPSPKRGGCGSL
jgi:hypothetical protein